MLTIARTDSGEEPNRRMLVKRITASAVPVFEYRNVSGETIAAWKRGEAHEDDDLDAREAWAQTPEGVEAIARRHAAQEERVLRALGLKTNASAIEPLVPVFVPSHHRWRAAPRRRARARRPRTARRIARGTSKTSDDDGSAARRAGGWS
jgi:hypothetical protein